MWRYPFIDLIFSITVILFIINEANGKTKTLSHNPDAVSAVIGSGEIAHPDNSPIANTKHSTKLNFFFN